MGKIPNEAKDRPRNSGFFQTSPDHREMTGFQLRFSTQLGFKRDLPRKFFTARRNSIPSPINFSSDARFRSLDERLC